MVVVYFRFFLSRMKNITVYFTNFRNVSVPNLRYGPDAINTKFESSVTKHPLQFLEDCEDVYEKSSLISFYFHILKLVALFCTRYQLKA
jgi:hypothetical protein